MISAHFSPQYYPLLDENRPTVFSIPNSASATTVQNQHVNLMNSLKMRTWLDAATVDLSVNFLAFNAETKVFLAVELVFTFHRGGYIQDVLNVHSETADLYDDGLAVIADVVWIVLITILMVQEVHQMELHRAFFDMFCMMKPETRTLAYWR